MKTLMSRTNRSNSTVAQFIRYVIVGGGATVIQWGLLVLLKEFCGLNANTANAIGFIGGMIFNYLISTIWVFDKSTVKNKGVEFIAFAMIGVVGLGINQGFIWLFDKTFAERHIFSGLLPADKYYLVGQVFATGISFFWNFFVRKYLLYNKTEE